MDPLVEEAVPGFSFAEFKRGIAVRIPFFEKHGSAILLTKVGPQSFFKAATEDHRCPRLFFPPSIQIAVTVGLAQGSIDGPGFSYAHLSAADKGRRICRIGVAITDKTLRAGGLVHN